MDVMIYITETDCFPSI